MQIALKSLESILDYFQTRGIAPSETHQGLSANITFGVSGTSGVEDRDEDIERAKGKKNTKKWIEEGEVEEEEKEEDEKEIGGRGGRR